MGADYPLADPRFRFTNAVVVMVLRLYYRPDWVERERRSLKTWVTQDATRWRSIEEEKSPEGVPVMVLGKQDGR